ncbi:MAG: MFS transporter [Bacillota bacterium]|nr:MFS transporter [Bacillota bacterium]
MQALRSPEKRRKEARRSRERPRLPWGELAIYLLGVGVGALDTSILPPVLGQIARDFHVSLAWAAWTLTAYTVAYAASTPVMGALGDRIGHVRVFRAGVAAFGLASVLAVLSPNLAVFLLARVIQGAGAGAVYPNAQAEGIALFPPERRGTALGIFGAVFGLASVIAPNLGGVLGQYFRWPSVFLLNLPLVLIVLWRAHGLRPGGRSDRPLPDVPAAAAFSGGLALFLLALTVQGTPGRVLGAGSVVVLALFLLRQRRTPVPFLDMAPLLQASGVALVAGSAVIGFDLSASALVPTMVQKEFDFSVLASGVAMMPAAVTGALLAGLAGVLVDRAGPRPVLQGGLGLAVVGSILMAWPHLDLPRFVAAMALLGAATAFTMGASINRLALALYGEGQAGEALSLVAVFRSVGMAAGPVLLGLAASAGNFTGMFAGVALASLAGVVLFGLVRGGAAGTAGVAAGR